MAGYRKGVFLTMQFIDFKMVHVMMVVNIQWLSCKIGSWVTLWNYPNKKKHCDPTLEWKVSLVGVWQFARATLHENFVGFRESDRLSVPAQDGFQYQADL